MSLRSAAREVVAQWALHEEGDINRTAAAVRALQHELSMTADAADLSAAINARRQGDSVERMKAFRARFDELLGDYATTLAKYIADPESIDGGTASPYAALVAHIFGES